MSLLDTASLVITPNGTKASKLYSVVPSDGSGDMTVTRATTATRVNSSGLIESVASNVPRLDYSNGSCPSILVEPQRTNLFLYSEQLDNAYWGKYQTSLTANSIVAPDGNTTADTITVTSGTGGSVYLLSSLTGTYTVSIFMKAGTSSITQIEVAGVGNVDVNLSAGTFTTSGSVTGSIKSFGNGWYRCTATFTGTAVPYIAFGITGTTGKTVYIWGAQLEADSYPTSYIPTTSASVTRNADVINKTGISSLIGQTEGTLFLDYQPLNVVDAYPIDFQLQYNGDNTNNGVTIYHVGNTPAITVRSGGSDIFSATLTATTVGTRNKIAIAYKNNDFAVYQNGVLKASQSTGIVPAILNEIRASDGNRNYSINLASVWKTRLTNTQLAQLTTI